MGYLHIWGKKGWFSGDWKEYFFLLSHIGLIYFAKPGVSTFLTQTTQATGFIPIIGGIILENPKHLFEKPNVFKISYPESTTQLFMSARSEIEKKRWVFVLTKVQELASKTNFSSLFN
jgi:hypothetical protein